MRRKKEGNHSVRHKNQRHARYWVNQVLECPTPVGNAAMRGGRKDMEANVVTKSTCIEVGPMANNVFMPASAYQSRHA
jgi:hypothetical protein